MTKFPQKHFSKYKEPLASIPDLISLQKSSFDWLVKEGLREIFDEFKVIKDYSEEKFELKLKGYQLDQPKFDEYYAKDNQINYEAALRVKVSLLNKRIASEKEQEIFVADFPIMTSHGTFIINGVERVVVPQLARSFGIFFTSRDIKGKKYFGAKIIPSRGAWIEIESEADGSIYVRIDRKRKFPVYWLLRVLSQGKDAADLARRLPQVVNSVAHDKVDNLDDAYLEIYRKVRDTDLAAASAARDFVEGLFSAERYDLSVVGRYRFNQRFSKGLDDKALTRRTLSFDDVATIVEHILVLNLDPEAREDDIDHLGLRRIRSVGEMMQQKIRVGMARMKRNIQDRMSTVDPDTTLPIQIINPRPLQAQIKEFFTTNQLSQFMNQENILTEIEHLRRLSALGPGGLTRERAGFEVRDVHPSHYGRLCPIQTPEGPNIGLILTLATYARVNSFGVIETPYRRVKGGKITDELLYLNALEEENYKIAHAAAVYDERGYLSESEVEVRINGRPTTVPKDQVDFIDIAPNQAYSVATSMIPFLEHDDANRALMGSNMQRQATPCLIPQAPLVATGLEGRVARDSGRLVITDEAGVVVKSDARRIVVKTSDGQRDYPLVSFSKTNGFTDFHQRPVVAVGQKVKKGDLLADSSSSDNGQVALGQNVLVAFMSWHGANYEDAIIISERLVKKNIFSSIHIEEFICNVRDTKLGPEITTHDIPNVSEAKLKNLDEDGIVRIGAEVYPNDILVGRITPKGETELTPEERLLRSIFGEKARDVKDSSLRMEHGKRGRVIRVKVFSRERGDKLESGIIKRVHIEVAQLRNVSVGDKLAGRHGNKGVISKVLPDEDMPYLADGRAVDVILTPLGVPSRMNLGQILEMHLGLAANSLGYQAVTPAFIGVSSEEISDELEAMGYPRGGKVRLFDGQTGETFDQEVALGYMYIMKLHHMVEDKIHMRSVGPYSLITQQPLGGKAQGGGQRFGEMEVWALEGYGAAHTLREMLTIKSDDIVGRSASFNAIIEGQPLAPPHTPASFSVLVNELKGLALDVELKKNEQARD